MTLPPDIHPEEHSWRGAPRSAGAYVELAIVAAILLTVVSIAAVQGLGSVHNADREAAQAQLAAIAPAISAYGLEHSTYAGMTPQVLARSFGIKLRKKIAGTLTVTGTTASGYCAQVRWGKWYAAQRGPGTPYATSKQPICIGS